MTIKSIMGIVGMALIISSCSASKEGRSMKSNINGNWVLQTITAEGITGVAKTTVFNEAEFGCFIGSSWNFIKNNSMGSYTIVDQKKECPSIKRFIRWSIYEPSDAERSFQFKRLDDKKNSMDNGDGYRLNIVQLDATQMKLRSEITFEGRPAALIYNFVKQ